MCSEAICCRPIFTNGLKHDELLIENRLETISTLIDIIVNKLVAVQHSGSSLLTLSFSDIARHIADVEMDAVFPAPLKEACPPIISL